MQLAKPYLLLASTIATVTLSCESKNRSKAEPPSIPAADAPAQTSDTPETSGCAFVSKDLHPDPFQLVSEYLRRDAAGDFTSSSEWDASSKTCPGHEPGWDTGTLITGYNIHRLVQGPDTARYLVTYDVYSPLNQDSVGFVLRPSPRQEVDTFVVLRTTYGWRIDSPVIDPHLLPQAALARLRFSESDKRILRGLVR